MTRGPVATVGLAAFFAALFGFQNICRLRNETIEEPDYMSLSKYMYETVSANATTLLPISSVCNARCIFCSNKMNPFTIYREGFRSLEDIKKGIALLEPGPNEIRIGDSLPGRISEGEALLHPDIFIILNMIRKKCPNSIIQVTTNGTMLTPDFVDHLEPFKPMKWTISYHSDNKDHWCKIFSLREDTYTIARNCFSILQKKQFIIEGTIVPLPNLVGYDDIENTIRAFSRYTKDILVYAPGYSKLVDGDLKSIIHADYNELSIFFSKMRKKYGVLIVFYSDPLMPLPFMPFTFMTNTFNFNFENVLWLFSEAAYERGKKIIESFLPQIPNNHYTEQVKNYTYEGNINVSGLLMVDDFDRAISEYLKEYADRRVRIDLLVLPGTAFDKFGDDLTGKNHSILEERYKLPIWLG